MTKKTLTTRQRAVRASRYHRAYQLKLRTQGIGSCCEVCMTPLAVSLGAGSRVCSPRCRLVEDAIQVLSLAIRENRAAGVREKLRRLAGARRRAS